MNPNRHSLQYRKIWLPLMRLVSWILLLLFGPFRVRGQYRVPRKGGLLILANHQSDIDPVAVQLACKRPIYFMAKSELFEMGALGWILKKVKAFPVKRGEPDKQALKHAAELLKEGACVCVYPEGQLSETGDLQPLKPGVALIVRMSGANTICLGLKNTNAVMPFGKTTPRPAFRTVEAHWGEAKKFEKHAPSDEIMTWADTQLRGLME